MESYLNEIPNRTHRVSYIKMKISNHRLAIATGRPVLNIPHNER